MASDFERHTYVVRRADVEEIAVGATNGLPSRGGYAEEIAVTCTLFLDLEGYKAGLIC